MHGDNYFLQVLVENLPADTAFNAAQAAATAIGGATIYIRTTHKPRAQQILETAIAQILRPAQLAEVLRQLEHSRIYIPQRGLSPTLNRPQIAPQ